MKIFKSKDKKRLEIYEAELIKIHYKEVENMYEDMRGWKHDFRNHIQVLKGISYNGSMDQVKAYLNQLEDSLEEIEPRVKTGNKMTDAILNSKVSLAKSKGIDVIVDAHIPVKLTTSSMDLSIILGNILDNGIESNEKLPVDKRFIRIYMDMKNTQLYISITNGAENYKKKKRNGLFNSTKGKNHGIGLSRIKDFVEKNGGYLNINSEEGAFSTEILLPQ